jgi:tetratricopeptide (TPR) repeat protein
MTKIQISPVRFIITDHRTLRDMAIICLIVSLFVVHIASAETKTFFKEYTYMASDIDSKVSSRAIALEQVKRALLEELGTYLISETEVKNYQLTKDQISTLTAGIVSAEVVYEKWDGRTYYLKARITADPEEIAKSVDELRNDVQKTKELEDARKKAEAATMELENLKHELELAKGDAGKQADYANAAKYLDAMNWFYKGMTSWHSDNFNDAIDAYTRTVELDPTNWTAYLNRGSAYASLGNYQQAINDDNKALELFPNYAVAYYNRGIYYKALNNVHQAINDYSKALELNPGYANAYANRGLAYKESGNTEKAIDDCNKAIALDPGLYRAYNNRGNAYRILGNYKQAISDLNKAIALHPNYAIGYFNRGTAYLESGNTDTAIQSYKIAAKLGLKQAQDYLRSERIDWR